MANACDSDDLPQRNARQRRRPEAMDLEVPLKSVHQHFDAPDHGASHVKMGSYKATTTAEEEDVQSGSHQQQYRADAEDGQNFECECELRCSKILFLGACAADTVLLIMRRPGSYR